MSKRLFLYRIRKAIKRSLMEDDNDPVAVLSGAIHALTAPRLAGDAPLAPGHQLAVMIRSAAWEHVAQGQTVWIYEDTIAARRKQRGLILSVLDRCLPSLAAAYANTN
jgi:hypothetical protein